EGVLERQRLEVELVRGVVIGRYGLRVAVDHDGLEPVRAKGERRVHAAVVELDSLPDAVRPAAEDHDLSPLARLGLAVAGLEGRVEIRRVGGERGPAGVDRLVDRRDGVLATQPAPPALARPEQLRQAAIREAEPLPGAELLRPDRRRARAAARRSLADARDHRLGIEDLLDVA